MRLVVGLFAAVALALDVAADEGRVGVSVLTGDTFPETVKDGFWLVEFYAPWCGHCKKLNPILDEIALDARAKHNMNIGKVDATAHKKLAESFDVHGYPTLKFRMSETDDWRSYEGGRSGSDILAFADRMSSAPVIDLSKAEDAEAFLDRTLMGPKVGFVLVLPNPSESATSVWIEVGKKYQHKGYFATTSTPAIFDSFLEEALKLPGGEPYVVVVEKGGVPRYSGLKLPSPGGDLEDPLGKWILSNNAPLVNELGKFNFRALGKLGKLLVIGITDPTNETATPAFRAGLETLAKSVEFRDAYVFGHLDGVFFKEYIAQFNIYGNLPRLVVLDMPNEVFYEDPEVNEGDEIESFLREVSEGKVKAQREGMGSTVTRFWRKMQHMGPGAWLMALPVVLLLGAWFMAPADERTKQD